MFVKDSVTKYTKTVSKTVVSQKIYKEYKTVKTNSSPSIENKVNTYNSSNKEVNPHWPKALVIPSPINSRPEKKKPEISIFFELSQVLKSKFICNDSQAK